MKELRFVYGYLSQDLPYMALGCLLTPILISFLVLSWLISLPEEWRFKRRMRDSGRVTSRRELLKRSEPLTGTFIVDRPSCSGWSNVQRVWWTDDDVLSVAPVKPLETSPFPEDDRTSQENMTVFEWHPFDSWIYNTYLHPVDGKAKLITDKGFAEFYRLRPKIPTVDSFSGGKIRECVVAGRAHPGSD